MRVLALLGLSGCILDFEPKPQSLIQCNTASECPPKWSCSTTLHRCLQTSGVLGAPPALAAPAVVQYADTGLTAAAAGVTIQVSFQVTEALLQAPDVALNVAGTLRPLSLVEAGDTAFTFAYPVRGDEPTTAELDITLLGSDGQLASGLSGGSVRFDFVPPRASSSGVDAGPARKGGTLTVHLTPNEPLVAAPILSLDSGQALTLAMSGDAYVFTYVADGTEATSANVMATLRDQAGNQSVVNVGTATFDFTPPGVASAVVAYTPTLGNPLARVTSATAGTLVTVSVVADELLDTTLAPVMTAYAGTTVIALTLATGSLTATHAVFSGVVPIGADDGMYTVHLSQLSDLAGNVADFDLSNASIEVLVSPPLLSVQQSNVRFVRSPWGDASSEPLGLLSIPSGPLFMLTPDDPLSAQQTLPASTFTLAPRQIVELHVYSDGAREQLLGTLVPNGDGSWPRQALARFDTPAAYVAGVDQAGNESALTKIAHGEWVATPRVASGGVSPHMAFTIERVSAALAPPADGTTPVTTALAGLDGVSTQTTSRVAWYNRVDAAPALSARANASAAYDSARGVTVLFGGSDNSGPLNDLYEWDGTRWTQRQPIGARPPAFVFSDMVFDSMRGVIVLFGTVDQQSLQVWEWNGQQWAQPEIGLPPLVTTSFTVVYDSARALTFGFAGAFCDPGCIDGQQQWTWDGAAFHIFNNSEVPFASRPSAREYAAMTFNPRRGVVVLFGGNAGAMRYSDTWEWDGATWTQTTGIPPQTPDPRTSHHLVYDEGSAMVLLFGGMVADSALDPSGPASLRNDLWLLDDSTAGVANWIAPMSSGAAPAPRRFFAMSFDRMRQASWLLTGAVSVGSAVSAESWEWTGRWRDATPSNTQPAARDTPSLAYDPVRDRTVMFGGSPSGSGPQHDTWELMTNHWQQVSTTAPDPLNPDLSGHAMVARPMALGASGSVILFGGYSQSNFVFSNSTFRWDGASWAQLSPPSAPTGRQMHAMAYDSTRDVIVMFGGLTDNGTMLGDTWELSRATPGDDALTASNWTQIATGHSPAARYAHKMAYDSTRHVIVLFGGQSADPSCAGTGTRCADTWEYTQVAGGWDWSQVNLGAAAVAPPARKSHGMAYDSDRGVTVVVGGLDQVSSGIDDIWEWDGALWNQRVESLPIVGGRAEFGMVFDGAITLFAGVRAQGPSSDTWSLDAANSRAPAAQFSASLAGAGLSSTLVQGLRLRGACGGAFGPTGAGARLWAWSSGGPGGQALPAFSGEWRPLSAASTATGPAMLDWSAANAAEARRYVGGQVAMQCRPDGAAGQNDPSVSADYMEVRVRYDAP